MGAVCVPAETRVHERLHADQGGSARNHVWEPAREVLHSGEFMSGLFILLLITLSGVESTHKHKTFIKI